MLNPPSARITVKKRKHRSNPINDASAPTDAPRRTRSRRGDGWGIAAFLGVLLTGTLLVLCLWQAIPGFTRGQLTSISAAQLEAGARPASGWVELSGVALDRERMREYLG